MSHTSHVHVINIITYCNHVAYYDMYTTLILICLHCSHYTPYNGAATDGSPQDNLIILKCSQFINVPHRRIKLLLALATAKFSLLVVQG